MALIAKDSGGSKFPPMDEGVYVGACYSIIDIGEQFNENFGNTSRKVLLTWEFPTELIEVQNELKPRAITKEYTISLSEKANLRHHLEAWRGKKFTDEELKGFDLKNILGKACQIQILHTTKGANTYANVGAIMSLPKGTKIDPPINPIIYFDLEAEDALEQIGKLPNWVQEKIRKSETYKRMTEAGVIDEGFCEIDESTVPF